MQIDWFTLVAQVINFIILVYLLRRFLYGPIVEAMNQREQKIAQRLQEADEKRNQAEQEAEHYREQNRALEKERSERMAAIREEVKTRRKELMKKTHQEIQEKQRDWRESLHIQKESFLQELRQRVGREAVEIARRALQDLAGEQLERQIAGRFVDRIQDLDEDIREEIGESVQNARQSITVRSTFELPQELRRRISQVVQASLLDGKNVDTQFENSSELIAGIELNVDGHKIAWDIEDYLTGLEEQIRRKIEHEARKQDDDSNGS